ncbi:hypothetical protein HI914_05559 [Erysiphe necator]|nr:hypothetical protein HI914_05559 [Erysiphe necator]
MNPQKLDSEKAWKLAHRAERVLKGHRRSDQNVGRTISSKVSRNNEYLKMVMKVEAHFHIPKKRSKRRQFPRLKMIDLILSMTK